jgi:hypothetical protein
MLLLRMTLLLVHIVLCMDCGSPATTGEDSAGNTHYHYSRWHR